MLPMDYRQLSRGQVLGIALVLGLAYYIFKVLSSSRSKVPGPWYAKWTSLPLLYHWINGSRAYWVHSLHQQYGPVVCIAPNEIDITDIEAVKTVYNVKETYLKSKFYEDLSGDSAGLNLFNTRDIEVHRRHRRLLGGSMSESSLKQFTPQIESKVDLVMMRMREEMKSRGAVDVWKWWMFMATDIIGELTFGESFKTLEQGQKSEYTRELERVAPLSAIWSTFPSLVPFATLLQIPALKTAKEATENMKRYSIDSLNRYQSLLDLDPVRARTTLFTKMFKASEEEKLSFDELLYNARAYIVAGSDTTSNTLTYLVWSVCCRPDIKATLLKELRTLPDNFSDNELRELPYLHQVIEETLRLYSAAPSALPRSVPASGAQLAGYWLEGGTTISAQAYSLHRNADVFPNPDEFNPSRWEKPTKVMKDSLMAFGKGARICIGLHLASTEMRIAAARFFLEFPDAKVSTLEGMGDKDMKPKIYFLITPQGKRCLIEVQ